MEILLTEIMNKIEINIPKKFGIIVLTIFAVTQNLRIGTFPYFDDGVLCCLMNTVNFGNSVLIGMIHFQ